MPELNSEAIDFRVASEFFAEFRRLKMKDLRSLRLVTTYQGQSVPSIGGVILFGKERLNYFPDAWIQAGRFEGRNRSRVLDHMELKMPLIKAIEAAIDFFDKHTMRGIEIGPVHSLGPQGLV